MLLLHLKLSSFGNWKPKPLTIYHLHRKPGWDGWKKRNTAEGFLFSVSFPVAKPATIFKFKNIHPKLVSIQMANGPDVLTFYGKVHDHFKYIKITSTGIVVQLKCLFLCKFSTIFYLLIPWRKEEGEITNKQSTTFLTSTKYRRQNLWLF